MTCRIELNGLRFYAHHGFYDSEQKIGQWFLVHLAMEWDADPSHLASDVLENTLNYETARSIVAQEMEQPSKLLEHLAWRIHQRLQHTFPFLSGGNLCISKQHPPLGSYLNEVNFHLKF